MVITRAIASDALKQAKIVIIDDDPAYVRILTRALKEQGFVQVHSFTDPRRAIELCQDQDPDLVILDLLMPHVSGLEVLKELRSRQPAGDYLPVLIMTGDVRPETKRTALACGATDFVLKPYDPTEFMLRITNLLETRLLHRDLSRQKRQLETAVMERTAELEAEIAERRRVEESLRQAKTKYRSILENAVFGVFQVTPQGEILTVNPALARLMGYESPSELQSAVSNVFSQLCPDAEQVRKFIQQMHEQGSVTGFEGPMYRKDGTLFWTSTSARVVRGSEGEIQYYEGTLADISARKEAEALLASANQELETRVQQRTAELTKRKEALRASHMRLETVLSVMPVMLWTTDRNGVFNFASGKVCSLLEQHPQQLVGNSVFDLYREYPHVIENHRRALQGESVDALVQFHGFMLDVRHVPLRAPDGELEGILGVAVDVTGQKRAEAVQREQKEILQAIFDHIPVMISCWDANGRFRLANREWERVIGWTTEEAQVEPDIFGKCHPDPVEYKRVQNFLRSPQGKWMDFRTWVRDGSILDTSWISAHLSDGSRIDFGLDVTARKRADRELQARLRQQAAVAVFGLEAFSAADIQTLFNRAASLVVETLGTEYSTVTELLPSREELVLRAGVGWKEGLVQGAAVPVSTATQGGYTLHSREPVIVEDLRTETRFNGTLLQQEHGVISGISVIMGPPERPFGVLCTHTSVSRQFTRDDVNFLQTIANVLASAVEREEAEKLVRSAKEEAERANRAKSEFLSRMSHELRTPLNAILGFAQLLELEDFTGEIRDNVEQIIKGGRHLLELINEILDIARIEAGKFALSTEAVDAHEAVTEALRLVAPLAARHGIRLEAGPATRDVFFLADRQRIRQVLLNLVSNAIKYNRDFGWVRVSFEYRDSQVVRLTVHDTGDGIAAENLPRLFTPFERLGVRRQDVEGAGIGLALSKRLIELMDGRIGVDSVVGEGSTFWIELPRAENPLDHAEVTGRELISNSLPVPRHTLLHIEDNLSNLKLIERVLSRRPDTRLLVAIQGELGLQLAREHRPELILLDMHLPDMDGHEVLQRLHDDPATRDIPVVMLSADATPGQIQRLLAAGAHDYLTKPLDVPKFLAVLDKLLGKDQEER